MSLVESKNGSTRIAFQEVKKTGFGYVTVTGGRRLGIWADQPSVKVGDIQEIDLDEYEISLKMVAYADEAGNLVATPCYTARMVAETEPDPENVEIEDAADVNIVDQ